MTTTSQDKKYWFDLEKQSMRYLLTGFTVLGIVVCWELISRFGFPNLQLVFPSIVVILTDTYALVASGAIKPHFLVTAQEVGIAVILALVIGIPLGIMIGTNEFVADVFEPLLYYFASIPKITLYPLFIVLLGVGIESKIMVGFLSAMFPLTVNTIVGALSVRDDLIKVARAYDASLIERATKVHVPSMVTYIINGVRLGASSSIISITLAEVFVSQAGLGNQMNFYFNNLDISKMYAILLIIFAFAFILNIGLLRFQQSLNRNGYGNQGSNQQQTF